MRLKFLSRPKPPVTPALCVPSSYCYECPVRERAAVCFFQRAKPAADAKLKGPFAILP